MGPFDPNGFVVNLFGFLGFFKVLMVPCVPQLSLEFLSVPQKLRVQYVSLISQGYLGVIAFFSVPYGSWGLLGFLKIPLVSYYSLGFLGTLQDYLLSQSFMGFQRIHRVNQQTNYLPGLVFSTSMFIYFFKLSNEKIHNTIQNEFHMTSFIYNDANHITSGVKVN